jgi:hypothetical protein
VLEAVAAAWQLPPVAAFVALEAFVAAVALAMPLVEPFAEQPLVAVASELLAVLTVPVVSTAAASTAPPVDELVVPEVTSV